MSSTDAHTGGSLSDMAVNGTSIPNDAGVQRLIPSVPRPDQMADESDLGRPDQQTAVGNQTDVPRQTRDIGATGEVMTGTGDTLPATIESKRLHTGAKEPQAKGHMRDEKHSAATSSAFEKHQSEGASADPAPGEEGDGQDAIRERKGL